MALSPQAIVAALVRVAATSSPTTYEFFANNGFEEEEKEEESGGENIEGFVRKLNGFLSMNLLNPKEESFDAEGIEGERSKVPGLKEKLAGRFFLRYYLGFFQFI